MKKVRKMVVRVMMAAATISMCLSYGVNGSVVRAEGEGPDPVSTLQNAFSTFNASQALYLDYSAASGDTTVNEQVEIDYKNKVKKITSEDAGTGKTTNSYIDLNSKITYIQKSGSKWEKNPTDSKDLQRIGKILSAGGLDPMIVSGVTYNYDGEEVISVANADSSDETEVECYRFSAAIPVENSDDYIDEEDEEEYDDEGEEADEEAVEPETSNVLFYVSKAAGQWVHAETDEDISLDIAYPDPNAVSLSIPKTAKKVSTLKSGYVATYKGVKYKVKYKNKKAYLVVSASTAKTKLNVEKTVKILGKKYKVTEIGDNAFAKNSKLKTLVVKADVTKIGKQAFYNSKKLKSITFKGTGINSVGKNAFKNVPKTATIKVPGKKKSDYSKRFKKAGFKGKVK